jgi:tetratricopeptide (TPR) repeat protein
MEIRLTAMKTPLHLKEIRTFPYIRGLAAWKLGNFAARIAGLNAQEPLYEIAVLRERRAGSVKETSERKAARLYEKAADYYERAYYEAARKGRGLDSGKGGLFAIGHLEWIAECSRAAASLHVSLGDDMAAGTRYLAAGKWESVLGDIFAVRADAMEEQKAIDIVFHFEKAQGDFTNAHSCLLRAFAAATGKEAGALELAMEKAAENEEHAEAKIRALWERFYRQREEASRQAKALIEDRKQFAASFIPVYDAVPDSEIVVIGDPVPLDKNIMEKIIARMPKTDGLILN